MAIQIDLPTGAIDVRIDRPHQNSVEISTDFGSERVSIDADSVGLPGATGQVGQQGLSAYQVALESGFSGTQEEWLESLKPNSVAAMGFSFVQYTPSAVWAVNHGFSQEPIVSVKDSAGSEIIADVTHPAPGITEIRFSRPTVGRARLV